MDILAMLKNLGYTEEDIEMNVRLTHSLLKQPITIDYAILKHEGRYGMIVRYGKIDENSKAELCGICSLIGALYGILTDGKDFVVIKPKSGYSWDRIDYIPSKIELEEELGIKRHTIIAISYDEYEAKVDDISFVVDNSRYVYSDMDRDEVVIVRPNARLIRWLIDRNVKFREFGDEDYMRLLDLD